ncbi:hypothetical protein EV681_0111 [Advenella incenata]|uniref:Uncharacterized protein n=1 Tax=Advenella incenata TaxID=267800 RepID=A0A4V2FTI9_9BURK|nr:hypothetical protein EV681_0111 [Advenella incenata]
MIPEHHIDFHRLTLSLLTCSLASIREERDQHRPQEHFTASVSSRFTSSHKIVVEALLMLVGQAMRGGGVARRSPAPLIPQPWALAY